MRRTSSRGDWRCVASAALAAAAVMVLPVGPAMGDDECAGENDVRLVLDEGPLAGGLTVQCVSDGGGRTAAEVTEAAGVEIRWVQGEPGSFVCRLAGRPADLPCADTPPADRYWGLFYAEAGSRSWTSATEGAGTLQVAGGSAVGWRLQDGGKVDEPAHVLRALPGVDGVGAGAQDPAATEPASEGSEGGFGSTPLAGLLLITGLCAAGFLAMRRRT